MIVSSIIFVISCIVLVLMWRVKSLELSTGTKRSVLDLTEIDEKIVEVWKRLRIYIKEVFMPKMSENLHNKLIKIENKIISFFSKYIHTLGHIADIVRGKDLPKNRGSVSFYWQHLDSMK